MEGNASTVDPGLSNKELAAAITELMGHLNSANRRWLAMIAEFDRRKGWSDSMTKSCAHWLNWQCGVDLGAAREKVRVAHALEGLPKIGATMGRGCRPSRECSCSRRSRRRSRTCRCRPQRTRGCAQRRRPIASRALQ